MNYDFIIIGTGAGGGTLARRLAPGGSNILILERGDFLPREVQNWDPLAVAEGRYKTAETWRDKDNNPISPYQHYWVGGNTKMYGGALLRMRERDFDAVEHFDGISPEWPLKYADFEPYYTEAEYLYSTHGQRGADPTEPPASKPYPYPALEFEPRMKEVNQAVKNLGYHPAPIPLSIRLPEDRMAGDKVRLTLFDGYPDPTGVKADAHTVGITKALTYANVTLLTNRKALRINTDETGRVATEVVVDHNGQVETFRGKTIIVACGAINSAALLLRSQGPKHPNGLANRSGQVGRNLMIHNNGIVLAYSGKENPSEFQKSFLLTDFYYGASDSPYPLGSIQLMGKADPLTLADSLGEEHLSNGHSLDYYARHIIDFFITAEDLPHPENRVVADANGGIQLVYHPNNLDAYNRLRRKLVDMMDQVAETEGVGGTTEYFGFKLGPGGVSHQSGTCRFGVDPDQSVLDVNCKAHDLDNLYVVDTSFFPSSGAVNPSLTAMANALRVGDHLLEKQNLNGNDGH